MVIIAWTNKQKKDYMLHSISFIPGVQFEVFGCVLEFF